MPSSMVMVLAGTGTSTSSSTSSTNAMAMTTVTMVTVLHVCTCMYVCSLSTCCPFSWFWGPVSCLYFAASISPLGLLLDSVLVTRIQSWQ